MLCGNESVARVQAENPAGWNYTTWIRKAKTSKHFDSFKVYILRCWNENEEFSM